MSEHRCGTCKHRTQRTYDFGMGLRAHRCLAASEREYGIGVQKHSPCFNGKWEKRAPVTAPEECDL